MAQYNHFDLEDTIVAMATPQGQGAIGVIRLSGKKAIDICNQYFPFKDLNQQDSHTIHFGTLRKGNEIIDEVVISLFKAPRSYTTEDVVEVSCHCSDYILQRVIALFLEAGARMARPGEFTLRAFLNGRMDLSQAEAVADLIASNTEAAHDIAIQQMRGGFSGEIQQLRQKLIEFASLVELELDFSEEDVEFADRSQLVELVQKIKNLLKKLIDSFHLGNAIKNGVTTVIAGRPNAGKSTLLNALLNEERAIVSDIPGTTRDTIEEVLNIDGIPFRFIDTAGIREASDTIEAIGVEKTMEKIKQSAIVVYLFDINDTNQKKLSTDLTELNMGEIPTLLVANKIDGGDQLIQKQYTDFPNILFISSKEKTNLQDLRQSLKDLVLSNKVGANDTIVSNLRHFDALQKANESLGDVLRGIDINISGELLSLDIRSALDYLGLVTGEVTTDDLLDSIFRNFCIGK